MMEKQLMAQARLTLRKRSFVISLFIFAWLLLSTNKLIVKGKKSFHSCLWSEDMSKCVNSRIVLCASVLSWYRGASLVEITLFKEGIHPGHQIRRSKINGKGSAVVDISTETTESPTFTVALSFSLYLSLSFLRAPSPIDRVSRRVERPARARKYELRCEPLYRHRVYG